MIAAVLTFLFRLWLALVDPRGPALVERETCQATTFGSVGDRMAGGSAACLGRRIDPARDVGIAHRWLPCGAEVLVANARTGASIMAVVVDRGPYGALDAAGAWFVKAGAGRDVPGAFRGCADLTPLVAAAIGSTGWARVVLTYPTRRAARMYPAAPLSMLVAIDSLRRRRNT